MEHGISKAKYRDEPKHGTVHIVASDCSSILPSWLETQIKGRVPVWYPPGAAAMWVRRCPSLHDAFTSYSVGDVVILLEGHHDLYSVSGAARWPNNRPHRDLWRNDSTAGNVGQSLGDDFACWLPSGVSIIGVDPDKVVIRHSGLVTRAVDTTHIAGVILKYVSRQLTTTSSHSAASRRCIPGLRVASGRLMLKHCRVDCGRRRDAANPGIWVGPQCVLNLHRSSVEGDAAVGLQLARGGLAVMGDSHLSTTGIALVAMDTLMMAGFHSQDSHTSSTYTKPATLLVGRACKLQVQGSLSRSSENMAAYGTSSFPMTDVLPGAATTDGRCTLLLLDARQAATSAARSCGSSSAWKRGSRGSRGSSSSSNSCDPGALQTPLNRTGTDNASIGALQSAVNIITHDRPLGVRVGVFSPHDSFNIARVEIPPHLPQEAASYAGPGVSHAVPFTPVTSDIARTLQPIRSQPKTGSSCWKYGVSDDDCRNLVQDLRRCMLSDTCLLIEVIAQEWQSCEGDRMPTAVVASGTMATGPSVAITLVMDVRQKTTKLKSKVTNQEVLVSTQSPCEEYYDRQVAAVALVPPAAPDPRPADKHPLQQQQLTKPASCSAGSLASTPLNACCAVDESRTGVELDAIVSDPQPAAAISTDKTVCTECEIKSVASVVTDAAPVCDGDAAPNENAFELGTTAAAGSDGAEDVTSPPRIGAARGSAGGAFATSPATANKTEPLDAALTPALLTVATVRAGIVPGTTNQPPSSRNVADLPSPAFSPYGFRTRRGRSDKRGQVQRQCSAVTFSLPADATDVQVPTPTCKHTHMPKEEPQLSAAAPSGFREVLNDLSGSKPQDVAALEAANVPEAAFPRAQSQDIGPVRPPPPAETIPAEYSDSLTIEAQAPPIVTVGDQLGALAAGGGFSAAVNACENIIDTSCLWQPEILASPPGLFAQNLAMWNGAQDFACADHHPMRLPGECADGSRRGSPAVIAATQVVVPSSGRMLGDLLASACSVLNSPGNTQLFKQSAIKQMVMPSDSCEDDQGMSSQECILAVYKAWQEGDDTLTDGHMLAAGLELDGEEERSCEDEFVDVAFRELGASEDNTLLQVGGERKGKNPFWWLSLEQNTEDFIEGNGAGPATGKPSKQYMPVGAGSLLPSPRMYGRTALAEQHTQSQRPSQPPLHPSMAMLMAAQAASSALLQHQNSCHVRPHQPPSAVDPSSCYRSQAQRKGVTGEHLGWPSGVANARSAMPLPHAVPGGMYPPAHYNLPTFPASAYCAVMPYREPQPCVTQPSGVSNLSHHFGSASCITNSSCLEGATGMAHSSRTRKRLHEASMGADGRSDDGAAHAAFAGADIAHYGAPSVPQDVDMQDAVSDADEGSVLPVSNEEGHARSNKPSASSAIPSQVGGQQCSAALSRPPSRADRRHANWHMMVEAKVSNAGPAASTGIPTSSAVTEGSQDTPFHEVPAEAQVDSAVNEAGPARGKRARRSVKGAASNTSEVPRPMRTTRRSAAAAASISVHVESSTAASSAVGVLAPTTTWPHSALRPTLHPPSPAVTLSKATCGATRNGVSEEFVSSEQPQEQARFTNWSAQVQELQQQILAQHHQHQQQRQYVTRQRRVCSLPPGAPVHGPFAQ